MSKQRLARTKVNSFIQSNVGVSINDLPDTVVFSDWIDDDMTESEIDNIVPDMVWEILDNSGMNRDAVDRICYGEDCDE